MLPCLMRMEEHGKRPVNVRLKKYLIDYLYAEIEFGKVIVG